jgi:hypothetical protein
VEVTVMTAIFVTILGLAFVAEDARSGTSGRLSARQIAIVVVAEGIVAFRIVQLVIR